MTHPKLILRAATRAGADWAPLPPQDVTLSALRWIGTTPPARPDPLELMRCLTRDARRSALKGTLKLDDPRPLFAAFETRVVLEGGADELARHLTALSACTRLVDRARDVLARTKLARHRPVRPGEAVFEPFGESCYEHPVELIAEWAGRDGVALSGGVPPFAFATRVAAWKGLDADELEAYLAAARRVDVEAVLADALETHHSGARDCVESVDELAAAMSDRAAGRLQTLGPFLERWNGLQSIASRVADRNLALSILPGTGRDEAVAWCREQVAFLAGVAGDVSATWPRRR